MPLEQGTCLDKQGPITREWLHFGPMHALSAPVKTMWGGFEIQDQHCIFNLNISPLLIAFMMIILTSTNKCLFMNFYSIRGIWGSGPALYLQSEKRFIINCIYDDHFNLHTQVPLREFLQYFAEITICTTIDKFV